MYFCVCACLGKREREKERKREREKERERERREVCLLIRLTGTTRRSHSGIRTRWQLLRRPLIPSPRPTTVLSCFKYLYIHAPPPQRLADKFAIDPVLHVYVRAFIYPEISLQNVAISRSSSYSLLCAGASFHPAPHLQPGQSGTYLLDFSF